MLITNPTPLFEKLFHDGALTQEPTALFLPVHGIGDKLRFYSYLKLFEIFNEAKARVLISSDFDRALLSCFPELARQALHINLETTLQLFANGQLVGDGLSLFPGAGQVFPTWHLRYLQAQGARWEQLNQAHVNHDLLVKQILHVPGIYLPTRIELPATPATRKVLLAPFNVSNLPAPEELWLGMAERLTAQGFTVVCNTSLGARAPIYSQDYSRLFSLYESLEVPIIELIQMLGGFAGVVSIRSGLCDLVSLTSVPAVTLTHSRISRFWDIPGHFGRHLQITFDGMPAKLVHQDIERFLSQQT